jgi:tryptophan-rich sensory protein
MFRPVSRVAAALLVPYWAWVTFATALNAAIWYAN